MERYVTAVRRQVEAGTVEDEAERAATANRPETDAKRAEILNHMPADDAGPTTRATPEGPFLARDPIVRLAQTSLDEDMDAEGVLEPAPAEATGSGHGWSTARAISSIPRTSARTTPAGSPRSPRRCSAALPGATPPSTPSPPSLRSPTPRASCSWAPGAPGWIARTRRAAHGHRRRDGRRRRPRGARHPPRRRRLLARPARVRPPHPGGRLVARRDEQSQAGVTSWALVGNHHDMYTGRWGFFEHLLADPRFRPAAQQRQPADELVSPQVPGWTNRGPGHVAEPQRPQQGHAGVLETPRRQ